MVIPSGVNIPMPRPHGGNPPVITHAAKGEGVPGEIITVQLVGEIGPLTQFLELLTVFDTATENDEIKIEIDTPGGDVYTTMNLVERMESCKAKVTTVASGLVASAGTFLWFYGHNREVGRWAKFLFHCSSHGDFGRSLSIQETANQLVKFMRNIGLQMLGAGILTHANFAAVFDQKADVELSATEIRKRLFKALKDDESVNTGDDGAAGAGEGEAGAGDAGTGEAGTGEAGTGEAGAGEGETGTGEAGTGEAGTGEGEAGTGEAGAGETGAGEGETQTTEEVFGEDGLEYPDETGSAGSGDAGAGAGEGETGAGEAGTGEGEAATPAAKCNKHKKSNKKPKAEGETGTGEGETGAGEGGTGAGEGEAGTGEGEAGTGEGGDTGTGEGETGGNDYEGGEGDINVDPEAIFAENGVELQPGEGEGAGAGEGTGEGEQAGGEGGSGEGEGEGAAQA